MKESQFLFVLADQGWRGLRWLIRVVQ